MPIEIKILLLKLAFIYSKLQSSTDNEVVLDRIQSIRTILISKAITLGGEFDPKVRLILRRIYRVALGGHFLPKMSGGPYSGSMNNSTKSSRSNWHYRHVRDLRRPLK
jgi:hypothetical protein